ncbi:MAG: hypothetical protein C0490_17615, partial [Marivirga sp.]|nr:hypothetical protein [Marivirga sp.]
SERTISLKFTGKNLDNSGVETGGTLYLTLVIRPEWHGGEIYPALLVGGDLNGKKEFGNGMVVSVESKALATDNVNVEFKVEHGAQLDKWIFGSSKGTRLEIGRFTNKLSFSPLDEDIDFNVGIKDCSFMLHKGESDSFIANLLPDKGISGTFQFGIGLSVKKRLYVDGGSGISVVIPMHAALTDSKKNNLILNAIYINGKTAEKEGENNSLETSVSFTASLLGLTASVERIGLLITDAKEKPVRFKPPTGIGIAVSIGPIKGGGYVYLDSDKGEYIGALELKFGKRVTLKAICIINTKIPGVDYSFLVIITTEFDPSLEIGLGFSLKGVGGIFGLHRTINIEALKEGVKTNAIRSILFPQDIIANITRIISDIKQVFPPLKGRTVIGLMAEFQYLKTNFFSIQLGFLVELDTGKLVILGVLALKIPNEGKQILKLQINFVGIIDFENKLASFDASLYDSRILTFPLTGDAAFRLSWGDPYFYILSIGGFHPAFTRVPDDLKNMRRITLSLLSGENPRFTIQTYLTSTSNTFQHGAKGELYAAKGSFNIYGFVSYDLLFRLTPGTITLLAHFAAGVSLRRNTSVIMGIQVSGEFTGFSPCHIQGKASVSFFFFSVSVPFSHTWGNPKAEAIADLAADILNM